MTAAKLAKPEYIEASGVRVRGKSALESAKASIGRGRRGAALGKVEKSQFLSSLLVLGTVCFVMLASRTALAQDSGNAIRPGKPWLDNQGKLIQAHGGGIIQFKRIFYWFGEDRSRDNDPEKRYVSCYSSTDLVHWKFRHQVLAISDPEHLGKGFVLERPKVFYNSNTKKFVMYMHLDGPTYKIARVAIAVSDAVDGQYSYVKSFRPLGQESRDIGQFIDDDGAAYLIFESRPTKGFFIAKLSDDYMNVERQVSFVHEPLEGGAIVHYGGLYYVVGSHLTGWQANSNVYASATSLAGPWTEFQNIAPPETNTYDSQSSMLVKVVGTRQTTVIYVGDRWNPKELWNSRYIWMPLTIGNGHMTLRQPQDWTINVRTGQTKDLSLP